MTELFRNTIAASVLDAMDPNVAVLDRDGVVVYSNAAWRKFACENGVEGEPGMIGCNYIAVTEESDDEFARAAAEGLREVLAGDRESFSLEYPCHSPTERRWFLLRATPFVHDGKQYVVVAHSDITDRRLAEEEVKRRAAQLEARQETLALLNQVVRHDIRNDVEVILGSARVLRDRSDVDEGFERFLDDILRTGNHIEVLTRTVGDLVDSLVDDEHDPKPVDVVAVVADEVHKTRRTFEHRSGAVTIRGPDDPPDAVVRADDLLSSVVGNLLDNAVFHNDEPDPTVEVSIDVEGDRAVLTVADDGPGIPDDRKDEVFGRGEKGVASSGSGLGLYLVDRLVDRYGGSVAVEDNDPKGALFRVQLPLARSPDCDCDRLSAES